MNQDISTALMVLLVGMITVFIILGLVVLTGNLLIKIVNRFAPLPSKTKHINQSVVRDTTIQAKEKTKIAAIVAAVTTITNGKGRIENIKKIT